MTVIDLRPRAKIAPPTAAHSDLGSIIGPTIETTLSENLAIRRFLRFQLDDIKFQLAQLAKDKTQSAGSFESNKQAAVLLSTYLIGAIKTLDEMIDSVDISLPAPDAAS